MARTANTRKEDTHDHILDVAARALRREGYAGVRVADVMKEAGLTHGGFYAHFPSREALLVEAIARAGRDSAAAVARAAESRRAKCRDSRSPCDKHRRFAWDGSSKQCAKRCLARPGRRPPWWPGRWSAPCNWPEHLGITKRAMPCWQQRVNH